MVRSYTLTRFDRHGRLMMERTYGLGESTATFVSCLSAEWRSFRYSVNVVHSKEIVCTLFCDGGIIQK
jgi:hypothetical protein